MIITILTDPSPSATVDAAVALEQGFKDDHISIALNPHNNPDLLLARMGAAVTTAVLDFQCYTASLDGSKVDGVMLVQPPGFEHGVSPNSKGPHTQLAKDLSTPEANKAIEGLKNLFNELETKAFGPTAVRDTYYVSHLATAPWAAGHGVGGQLLKAIIERATKEGVPVTLVTMTPRHEEYYKRYGFTTKHYMTYDLNGTPTEWWAMSTDL